MKKVLLLNSYHDPDIFAFSRMEADILERLVTAGIYTDIIVPLPTRMVSNSIRREYKKRKIEIKFGGKITIHRFSIYREPRNALLRTFRYILIHIVEYFKGINTREIDAILGVSTPPTQGALCALVKKRLNVPFVYSLQDIFPDSMVNAGMTHKGSALWNIGRKLEDFTYKHADMIIVISEGFKQNIMAKGVPEEKIAIVPNWVDTDVIRPIAREKNKLFDELNLDRSKFFVTYAGTLGPAQDLGLLLDAAEKLKDFSNICIVIFGEGTEKEKLSSRIEHMENVWIFPLQPQERVSEVYSLGDLSIVIAKKGAGNSALPSKTWSIMSSGRPVLASFDKGTEIEKILINNHCGKLVTADDCGPLADQILWFMQNPSECVLMGENARKYVSENSSRNICTQKYMETLLKIMIK